MQIEYSNEVKGMAFAYRFTDAELKEIALGLKFRIRALKAKIERIRNHPRNEGQAKYILQIDTVRYQIEDLEEIIKTFSS